MYITNWNILYTYWEREHINSCNFHTSTNIYTNLRPCMLVNNVTYRQTQHHSGSDIRNTFWSYLGPGQVHPALASYFIPFICFNRQQGHSKGPSGQLGQHYLCLHLAFTHKELIILKFVKINLRRGGLIVFSQVWKDKQKSLTIHGSFVLLFGVLANCDIIFFSSWKQFQNALGTNNRIPYFVWYLVYL